MGVFSFRRGLAELLNHGFYLFWLRTTKKIAININKFHLLVLPRKIGYGAMRLRFWCVSLVICTMTYFAREYWTPNSAQEGLPSQQKQWGYLRCWSSLGLTKFGGTTIMKCGICIRTRPDDEIRVMTCENYFGVGKRRLREEGYTLMLPPPKW